MKPFYLKTVYLYLRKLGWKAGDAFQCYKAKTLFSGLENPDEDAEIGSVRIKWEQENESYFDVYGEPETEEERESIVHAIETYGCWVVCSQVRKISGWETVDSVGMIVGEPDTFDGNPYLLDLMRAAIRASANCEEETLV